MYVVCTRQRLTVFSVDASVYTKKLLETSTYKMLSSLKINKKPRKSGAKKSLKYILFVLRYNAVGQIDHFSKAFFR